MFKINKRNTKKSEIYYGDFTVNFEHILQLFLVLILFTLNR